MKVLLITDEVWNDQIHGNNNYTNWFEDFDAELANIYCNPGYPSNRCCAKYFQITDMMMAKSLFSPTKAGKAFNIEGNHMDEHTFVGEEVNPELYSKLKAISSESMRAIRELIWYFGKYDLDALEKFIRDFKPDLIFSPRLATIKLLRLERIVLNIAQVPLIAFTGDAEYTLRQFRISPVFWIKNLFFRRIFKAMMPYYSLYYSLSDEQKSEYEKTFGDKFKVLRKSGDFTKREKDKSVTMPIRMIYAGKLYSNRWKTLVEITKALKIINNQETKITLEIYTKDKLSKRKRRLLEDGKSSFVRGPVPGEELKRIYDSADIALHVEAFDLKSRLITRVSFSTKIIDCLASGCAVMAVCWDKHSGYTYLKKEDAAFTISRKKDIQKELVRLVEHPQLIPLYAEKALECGHRNHQKSSTQKMLYDDFSRIIQQMDMKDEHKKAVENIELIKE